MTKIIIDDNTTVPLNSKEVKEILSEEELGHISTLKEYGKVDEYFNILESKIKSEVKSEVVDIDTLIDIADSYDSDIFKELDIDLDDDDWE